MLRKNFEGRRRVRRDEAAKRAAHRATLTLDQRLALCDDRPGRSERERMKLAASIAALQEAAAAKQVVASRRAKQAQAKK